MQIHFRYDADKDIDTKEFPGGASAISTASSSPPSRHSKLSPVKKRLTAMAVVSPLLMQVALIFSLPTHFKMFHRHFLITFKKIGVLFKSKKNSLKRGSRQTVLLTTNSDFLSVWRGVYSHRGIPGGMYPAMPG